MTTFLALAASSFLTRIEGESGIDASLFSNPAFLVVVFISVLIFLATAASPGKSINEEQAEKEKLWKQADDAATQTATAKANAAVTGELLRFMGVSDGANK